MFLSALDILCPNFILQQILIKNIKQENPGGRGGGGGGNSTLIRRVCTTGILHLSPCSGVGKPKKDTLFWSYNSFFESVLYCIVLYCIVLYCIVLYCAGDKDHVYTLVI